ncbi:MAG: CDP-glycerol glycerophosphotransferase family protein, partial [Sedimentisphaerales bacterium]|nr:CDP-glycerol glycerophosphotransferase family protein [Sedimentisphaerales bacterium]
IQKLINESSLLITDYSSVSWDFFYLCKPVIFYQFDFDDYLKNRGSYLDLKNDIFGDRTESNVELMQYIKFYINNSFSEKEEYTGLRNKFFKYSDNFNCKRIYEETKKL